MKKLLLTITLGLLIFQSCETSKAVVKEEVNMRGDWVISDVSVTGIQENLVSVKLFDEADANCFEGSTWHLVQNNASGTYQLNGANGCPSSNSKIKWFVTEDGANKYFNFKKIFEGVKPKHIVDGYKMRIVSNNKSTFVLTQDLMFEGKPININYTFEKL